MFMVTRKPGERILITLDPAADADLSARDLFAQGAIEIVLAATSPSHARVAVAVPDALVVSRLPRSKS